MSDDEAPNTNEFNSPHYGWMGKSLHPTSPRVGDAPDQQLIDEASDAMAKASLERPLDFEVVDISQDRLLKFWTQALNASEDSLKRATLVVGFRRVDVVRYLADVALPKS